VIGRHWRDPAPVVDPRVEEGPEVVGEVGGCLQVDVSLEDQPGHSDRPLAWCHRPQRGELFFVLRPRVGVRQEAGVVDHDLGHRRDVVDRRGIVALGEPAGRDLVVQLRPLAEGEERLVAAGSGPSASNREHLVSLEVGGLEPRRRLGEGAVAAAVPAELGERDEDLR
jgi:hypothetical protein